MLARSNEEAQKICEQLIERGYTKYKPSCFDKDVECVFQKRFDDEKGKRYFLDVKMYPAFSHPYTKQVYGPCFEISSQMYQAGTHSAVNLECLSEWGIDQAESFFEKLFQTGMFDYYEVF